MSPKTSTQFEKIRLASKKNIINAALKLFSKNGYDNTSVRMIAKEAGISIGLMYNYFQSKEEMVLTILAEAFNDLDSALMAAQEANPKEQFRASIEQFVHMILKKKEGIRMLAQMGLHQKKFKLANELTKGKYEDSVQKIAKNLQSLGFDKNSVLEARFIVAALDGLTFESLLMGNSVPLEEIKNYVIQKYCGT